MSDSYKTVPEEESEEELSLIDGQLMVTAASDPTTDEYTSLDTLDDTTDSIDKESLDFLVSAPSKANLVSRAVMLGDKGQILDVRSHKKKMHYLSKVADGLHQTEWQYEPIFKLLGD